MSIVSVNKKVISQDYCLVECNKDGNQQNLQTKNVSDVDDQAVKFGTMCSVHV